MTLLLQRSVWHTHLMRRPLKRVCASQVACGQDFSAMSQAAADKSVTQQAIKKNTRTILSLPEVLVQMLMVSYRVGQPLADHR